MDHASPNNSNDLITITILITSFILDRFIHFLSKITSVDSLQRIYYGLMIIVAIATFIINYPKLKSSIKNLLKNEKKN